MSHINEVIELFQGVSLEEMDGVKLMNRTDQKYWFHASYLADLLNRVKDDYYLLEINGERNLPYSTLYYDTPDNEMYQNHHRGKGNRYKIRRRNYISTQSSFLEIKFKSNKGRTIKTRRASCFESATFDSVDSNFIEQQSPYSGRELHKVLANSFHRLMLVSKSFGERCTIDSNLCFDGNNNQTSLENLVIVEVKRDGRSPSVIVDSLRKMRLKPSGFSKYFVGRSITDNTLKQNLFKAKLREIDKRIDHIVI